VRLALVNEELDRASHPKFTSEQLRRELLENFPVQDRFQIKPLLEGLAEVHAASFPILHLCIVSVSDLYSIFPGSSAYFVAANRLTNPLLGICKSLTDT
jgi:hypothetical protein